MRIGLVLPTYFPTATVEGIRETALLGEQAGFDSLWTTDHVMVAKGAPIQYESIFESLSLLPFVAALTSRVRLGVSVLIVTMRPPVLVAKEAASIDRICGGRLVLGVAAGWSEPEFGYLGADFKTRGTRCDEAIRILRSLWSDPSAPFSGPTVRFEGHSFGPAPVQPGGPPIWVGGDSDAALRRAAWLGDAWHGGSSMSALDTFAEAAAKIREMQGERSVELTLRARFGEQGGAISVPEGPVGWPGRRQWVIGGSADQVVDHLGSLERLGCSEVVLCFWEGHLAQHLRRAEWFAANVLPQLKGPVA